MNADQEMLANKIQFSHIKLTLNMLITFDMRAPDLTSDLGGNTQHRTTDIHL